CSPSFNWKKKLGVDDIAEFQKRIGAMGYKFQFITLAGFHSLNYGMFHLAEGYARRGMSAFVELQEAEFAAAVHERFPGKLLAYNCSPSFNWKRHLGDDEIASFRETLGELGYRFQFITLAGFHSLNAARLAADIEDVPTIVVARTDALAADLLTSDVDPTDEPFLTGERTSEGFFRVRNGIEPVLARAKAYAPYADLIWVETGTPDLGLAREFATELHKEFPDQLLAYNCSPSFNWKAALSDSEIAAFQDELGELGYAFQFITLAGFHALNASMFELAHGYARTGMSAYVELQEAEFAAVSRGYTAVKHQAEVGTGYFDKVATALNPTSGTLAMTGSTEEAQFH
ncbi:MAG TPA: hypothetical protein VHC41_10815, partial [Mycobacteriales bacterium]|nr:hypothetical protein [Mycobacteriales bacterium]